MSFLRAIWADLYDNSSPSTSLPSLFYRSCLDTLSAVGNFGVTAKALYSKFLSIRSSPSILHRQWTQVIGPGFSLNGHWSLVRDSFTENRLKMICCGLPSYVQLRFAILYRIGELPTPALVLRFVSSILSIFLRKNFRLLRPNQHVVAETYLTLRDLPIEVPDSDVLPLLQSLGVVHSIFPCFYHDFPSLSNDTRVQLMSFSDSLPSSMNVVGFPVCVWHASQLVLCSISRQSGHLPVYSRVNAIAASSLVTWPVNVPRPGVSLLLRPFHRLNLGLPFKSLFFLFLFFLHLLFPFRIPFSILFLMNVCPPPLRRVRPL